MNRPVPPYYIQQGNVSRGRAEANTMRLSKIVTWVFFLAGLTLLLGMVYQVGLTDLLQSVEAMGLWLFPYLLLKAIPLLIHTAGWAACFSVAQPQPSFWQVVLVSRAGGAINQITPTATLGGEMVKVLLLEPMIPRQQGMAAVIIDKATITLSNMMYVTLGALYLTHVLPLSVEIQLGLSITIGLLFLGLIGFVATQRYGLVSKALLALERLRIGQGTLQHLRQKVLPLEAHLMEYYTQSPWRFVRSLLLHSTAHACNAIKTYILLCLLLGAEAPTLVQAIMVEAAVAALDQIFFFVPGRIGTLEWARFMVLSSLGVAQIYGLAFGLIARVEQLLWSGIGMIAYAFCTRRARRSPACHEARVI